MIKKILNSNLFLFIDGWTIFVLVAGLYFGTLCTFVFQYDYGHVDKEQTITQTAVYKSYDRLPGRYRDDSSGIYIYFMDSERLLIRGTEDNFINYRLLKAIKPGTPVHLLLHPRSRHILEFRTDYSYILRFEDTQRNPWWNVVLQWTLGIGSYAAALYALVELIKGALDYRKFISKRR